MLNCGPVCTSAGQVFTSFPVMVCRVNEADGRVAGSSKGVGGQRGGVREEGS